MDLSINNLNSLIDYVNYLNYKINSIDKNYIDNNLLNEFNETKNLIIHNINELKLLIKN